MKNFTFLLISLFLASSIFSQENKFEAVGIELSKADRTVVKKKQNDPFGAWQKKPPKSSKKTGMELSFVNLGQQGNNYGFQSPFPRTMLWADNNINSIIYTKSRGKYTVSWNKGAAGSWHKDVVICDTILCRNGQGGIINPAGNTNPDNAIYTYFMPLADGSNGTYGGYAYGINLLTQIDPPSPTQNEVTSSGDFYRGSPKAFTVTQTGNTWVADPCFPEGQEPYNGNFIINKGMYNESIQDIEYTEWLMPVLEENDGINDSKIAFDPSGQYGYLLVMSNSFSNLQPYTYYHPILYATSDGGDTWSEQPIHCQLGGIDGLPEVKNFISDEVLLTIYGPAFNRDEIVYNMGYRADMVVDHFGNPHITGLIACGEMGLWYPVHGSMGTFHVWYDRQNESWDAEFLYFNRTLTGDLGGGTTQDNRPQISSDMDGWNLFISWIDSDMTGVTENIIPDIFMVHYDVGSGTHSDVENITEGTQAENGAYLAIQSHYVFEEASGNNNIEYTIPFMYNELDPNDPAAPVTLWYIGGVKRDFATDMNEHGNKHTVVEQNYPNPFSKHTNIAVSLHNPARLKLEVFNITGQKIMEIDKGKMSPGKHRFKINAENLRKGIYFYTIFAGDEHVTKKMILR